MEPLFNESPDAHLVGLTPLSLPPNNTLLPPNLFGINSLAVSYPAIPFIEDGFLKGDANNDGGLTNLDLDLILKDRNKPIVGVNDPRDFDGDSKITIFDVRKLGLVINQNQDKTPPSLSAFLANDTGTNTDKITADPAIKGTVKDASRLTRIRAGIDHTDIGNFTNIRGVVAADGTFALTAEQLSEINNKTPLSQGQHTLHLFSKDQWNNTSTFDLTFTLDSNNPIINASLTNDTGSSANDKITKDAAISGSINDLSQIVSFKAGFDNTSTANFVNVLGTLKGNAFAFDQNKIKEINGGNLGDGSHTLKLIATDIAGNTANFDYAFTVDTIAPQIPGFMLDSLFDSAPVGDSITKYAAVNLLGKTEANTTVLLQGTGKSTTADATGKFTFNNVALTLGDNSFTAVATDNAGNTRSFTDIIKRVTQSNSDVVLDWNTTLLNAIYTDKTAPPRASRNMAIAQTAVFDAINSITKTYKNYYFTGIAPTGADAEAAAAAAAHRVLVNLYPGQITYFDTALTASLADIPDGAAEDAGVTFGRTVADSILSLRSADGSGNTITYTPGTNPGDWQPTAPGFAPALLPQWGQVTPFGLTSGDQFRPDGPPALDSQQYTNDYNQVKDLGKKDSTTRTAEQTEIALFWADSAGTFTPPGHWNQIAQNVAANKGNSLVDNARLFALLDISIADAGIAAWDAKYQYNFWRPITAIQKGDTDGNPNTIADPNWTPLITTPPFPDYISGHSTFSGAAATILTGLLGNDVSFTVNSLGLPGVYRQFNSFTAAADEAAISRLYGGIHFNTANVDGLATGKSIGSYVLQNLLSAVTDNQPPVIQVSLVSDTGNSNSDRITSNPAVAGKVTDTSQIVKLQAKLNSGNFVDVLSKLNADGSFSLDKTTLTQINGGQLPDGIYQLSLKGEDKFGNASGELKLEFTLDSTKPLSPSQLSIKVSQNPEINNNKPTIIGEAETGTKVAIFDGTTKLGETTAVANKWEITTSQLTDGVKNLTVIATDVAGNVSDSQQLIITIDTAPVQQLNVMPGGQLKLELKDIFGKNANFALESQQTLPTGNLDSDGTLIFKPAPSQIGTYDFTLVARDGEQVTTKKFHLAVVADTVTTTRINGVIQNIAQQPLAGVKVKIGDLSTTTAADGSFTLTLTQAPSIDAALVIEPGQQVDNIVYPSIAEKLPLLLGHNVYQNVKNVIDRPIYLPPIDISNAQTINPSITQIVTSAAIPGSSVKVAANTLFDQQNRPYTGKLSITTVPTELTPAALPDNLRPDLVVTIQPGEMRFTTPAPLSLPNLAGYAPGTQMDLWSINPQTGFFDKVGIGQVSADGKVINTISGGIRNSSWHFFAPPAPTPNDPNTDPRNPEEGCDGSTATGQSNSDVELYSGAEIETHDLVAYQSLGVSRGLTLRYDSQRADARPIVHFGYNNVPSNPNLRLMAELTIKRGDFTLAVPGFAGGKYGLNGGENFWSIPNGGGKIDAALQADLRTLSSGRYDYDLTTGLLRLNNNQFNGSTSDSKGKLLVVNTVNSAFGSGWGLAGLQELVVNPDGSVLLIDGDGSELLFEKNADNTYKSPAGHFSTLERLGNGTFRHTTKDQTVYSFDAQNKLVDMRDRLNNETRYVYQNGLLSKIVDPVGLETTFTYSGNKITAITDPAGRVTKLTYDINGNLLKITDPDGTGQTWEYDANHHMTAGSDQLGNRGQTFYNFAGRVTSAILKDGSTVQFDPVEVQGLYEPSKTNDPLNAPVAFQLGAATSTYTDSNGKKTVNTLDRAGQIVSSSDEVGLLPSVKRNQDNLVTQQTDARGNATSFTYDAKGNVITIQDSLSFSTKNAGGNVLIVNGASTASTNNLTKLLQEAGLKTTVSSILPTDVTGFSEIWDTRYNASISSLEVTKYLSFLQAGGDLFLIGENQGFASRNNSIINFISQAGGGQLNFIALPFISNVSQSVLAPFNNPNLIAGGKVGYNAPGGFSGSGNGKFVTIDTSNNGTAVAFDEGDLKNAPQGELKVILDINFTEAIYDQPNSQNFLKNLIQSNATPRKFTYDPKFNQLTSKTDELGHQTLYQIDPNNGNLLSLTQVVGAMGGDDDLVTKFTYTGKGLVDLITDPLGRITDSDYDIKGRLTSIIYAKGTTDEAKRQFSYDVAGNQTAIIDENGNVSKFEYDVLNRLVKTIEADPDGAGTLTSPVTTYSYDARGNLISTTDAVGHVAQNAYDKLNRLIQSIDALNQKTSYGYDKLGNLLSVVDPLGHKTENKYDARNRLVETIAPDLGSTKFTYDLSNNLASVTDPVSNKTIFAYDARNRLISETDPLGKTSQYQYDSVNNLIGKTDRNNRRIEYKYDDINRRITETWVGNNEVINYSYDKASNQTAVNDKFSSLAFTYDNRDSLLSVNNAGTPGFSNVLLNYGYDKVGNVVSVADKINNVAGGTNSYTYDALNRLTKLTQSGNGVNDKRVDFSYNVLGQYTSVNRYANLTGTQLVNSTTYTYDSLNRLTNLNHSNGTNNVAFYNYAYDVASRITKITDVDGATDYTYDNHDQLTSANHSNANNPDETYTYDANGNRITSSIHGNGYVTGKGNRLLSDGKYNYEYDNEGNLTKQTEITTGKVQELTWDHRNRLVAFVNKDAAGKETQRVEFTYDVFNRRIAKAVDTNPQDTTPAVVTQFIYDGQDVLLEFIDSDGTGANQPVLDKRYLHGAGVDQVLAQESAGNVVWHLTDHLGTVRDLVNNSGAVVNHLVYDSFGQVISESNAAVDTRYLFTGREFDSETGLYYYRARYYDATNGRFISLDAIGIGSGSVNLYSYVGGNPISFVDMFGNKRCSGNARVLQGNKGLIGKEGAFSGNKKYPVTDDSAAILLEQFGKSKADLRPDIDEISGKIGDPKAPSCTFSKVRDRIDDNNAREKSKKTPYEMWKERSPGNFIVELPGIDKDFGVQPIELSVPDSYNCPEGTKEVK